jgi:hypothetical protein
MLEGWPGFFVAATAGLYVYLKYAKAQEILQGDPKDTSARPARCDWPLTSDGPGE